MRLILSQVYRQLDKKIIFVILLFLFFGCTDFKKTSRLGGVKEMEGEKNKKDISKVADKKAIELGYNLDQMNREISRSDNLWVIYYSPISRKDLIVTGGDLKIYLDDKGEVVKFLRGQ